MRNARVIRIRMWTRDHRRVRMANHVCVAITSMSRIRHRNRTSAMISHAIIRNRIGARIAIGCSVRTQV